ncbi:60S ribosomal protein L21 [Hyalella azteca]|uniref:Large ribosomal subunit protein eL21 n=1 Tax=Hyalella azteca TaxID=294128 RepID=A0A979FHD6_HYAAZ|nr:60S ribosomal protein L21 [Hyalella azteca]XP_047736014.1 60S ribosomal protein L21 [Hyalella azteca]
MTNPKGTRRGTRDMFSRGFKKNGVEHLTTYLRCYKMGQLVDIKGNGAFQKGMPHKSYHGKTGRIFNVTPHALGVVVNKRVRGRIFAKRINVRIEHVSPSKCRDDHIARVKYNDATRRACQKAGKPVPCLKRRPAGPKPAHYVNITRKPPTFLTPIPYQFVV